MALLYRQVHGLAMALAAMWSGSAALAQPGGLYLNSPLSLSAGRDSGFLVGAAAESDEVALISMPEGLLLKATPRLNVSIKYRPEFEIFAGRRNLDSWNHHAGLQLSYRATPRAYVEIGDSFLATNDPDRQFAETLVHLPRGNFKENSFYFDAGYSLSPVTTVDVRFDNGVTTSNFLGAARIGFFDHVTYAGTAGIARIFGPKHRLSASYSYVDLRLLDAGNRDVPESAEFIRPAHSLTGGYRYSSNPGLAVTVSGAPSGIRDIRILFRARLKNAPARCGSAPGICGIFPFSRAFHRPPASPPPRASQMVCCRARYFRAQPPGPRASLPAALVSPSKLRAR